MILTSKNMELAAVTISITAGCLPCTRYHIEEAGKVGASSVELLQSMYIAVASSNRQELSTIALDQFHQQIERNSLRPLGVGVEELYRQGLLSEIGLSVSQNNVAMLESKIKRAKAQEISDDEVTEVVALANRIKEKAASHLDRVTTKLDADPEIAKAVAGLCT